MHIATCLLYAFCPSPLPFLIYALTINAQDSDVEGGSPLLQGLVLIEPLQMNMDGIVARCCRELVSALRRPLTTEIGHVPLLEPEIGSQYETS